MFNYIRIRISGLSTFTTLLLYSRAHDHIPVFGQMSVYLQYIEIVNTYTTYELGHIIRVLRPLYFLKVKFIVIRSDTSAASFS